ncbi:MAG: hypothetical protein ACLUFU_00870 [Bacilli bacterium]
MKKVLLIILVGIFLVGCSCTNNTAKKAVEEFLDQYRNLSASVIEDMDDVVDKEENLSDEQKDQYRDILRKQYTDLTYEIVNEEYNEDTAVVETKITVYNLGKVQNEANDYLTEHSEEFYDEENNYDISKFLDYKLDLMQKNTETITYTIYFNVERNDDDIWQVTELSQDDLEKIHGIYNENE